MIPHRLIRTVPAEPSAEAEQFWRDARALHEGWDTLDLRDPVDLSGYPRTAAVADRCTSGAQFAGILRLEALWLHGGVYLDSDFECYRSFRALIPLAGFAGWEDPRTAPDAVLGFEAHHPAIAECLDLATTLLDKGPWSSGPGVTTTVLPRHADVVLLPPGAFYPYHYSERSRRHEDHAKTNPWAFGAHHWAGSWLS